MSILDIKNRKEIGMSNVQEALNEAIEMITILCNGSLDPTGGAYKVVNQCKAALADIEKCEPVYLISSGVHEIAVSKAKYDEWTSSKRISYTSPQPRDLVVPSNEVIDTLWHKATHESVAHSEPFTRYRFSELLIKQLNTKG